MLWPLPFIAMRQEQGQPTKTTPLGFARTDELIDDDLRTVGEVTELSFPDREAVGFSGRETVFEAHDGFFAQQRVDDRAARRAWRQMLERDVTLGATLVVPHGMTMEERAAAAVLTGDTNFVAFGQQRRI